MAHIFQGKWITDSDLLREPRNVFHRQLQPISLPKDEKGNNHVLFRKKFYVKTALKKAVLYITADDHYKAYINGRFVAQGPAPSYHCRAFRGGNDSGNGLRRNKKG